MKLPEPVKQAITILEEHGYEVEVSKNKHIRLKADGLPPLFFAASASDWRAGANLISLTKRTIRMAQ
jgi:hypothetical protein